MLGWDVFSQQNNKPERKFGLQMAFSARSEQNAKFVDLTITPDLDDRKSSNCICN